VGYCSACDFPYVPCITEMEQHCLKDSFSSCATFYKHLGTEQIRMCEFNTLKSVKGGLMHAACKVSHKKPDMVKTV
jgi:hypothetical protein